MKILLFGKNGLLGNALFNVFSLDNEVDAPNHNDCDITDINSISKQIRNSAPDLVINAAGYTNVDLAEKEKELAFKINADGVLNIVKTINNEVPLVHFSTDYVFDGKKMEGYKENDPVSPISVYGESKAKGEENIIKNCSKFFLIRTSWLFGEYGKNFVEAILNLAKKNEQLKIVNDQIGSPTYVNDLAKGVLKLIRKNPFGIYHLTNDGSCSWYNFAVEIFSQLGIPKVILPISSNELGRPAKRPKCSILINTKSAKLRPWKEALSEYLQSKTIVL